jgi:hypothetical protein
MGIHSTLPVSWLLLSQFLVVVFYPDHVCLTVMHRYGALAKLSTDDDITKRIDDSVRMLRTHLDQGHVVYGKSH